LQRYFFPFVSDPAADTVNPPPSSFRAMERCDPALGGIGRAARIFSTAVECFEIGIVNPTPSSLSRWNDPRPPGGVRWNSWTGARALAAPHRVKGRRKRRDWRLPRVLSLPSIVQALDQADRCRARSSAIGFR